jgi:hypothetical protein
MGSLLNDRPAIYNRILGKRMAVLRPPCRFAQPGAGSQHIGTRELFRHNRGASLLELGHDRPLELA